MRVIFFSLLVVTAFIRSAAAEHFKRPAPYTEARIYVLANPTKHSAHPSPDYIRSHADRVFSIDAIEFWDYLRWGNAKNDRKIRQHAGPIRMVIDLYQRVQPRPPEKPDFHTLYCTRAFIYSDECDYLELKPPTSTHLNSFLHE